MISKEKLSSLIDEVCFRKKVTREKLAEEMTYSPTYISEILGPKGVVTKSFVNVFTLSYWHLLQDPSALEIKPGSLGVKLTKEEFILMQASIKALGEVLSEIGASATDKTLEHLQEKLRESTSLILKDIFGEK